MSSVDRIAMDPLRSCPSSPPDAPSSNGEVVDGAEEASPPVVAVDGKPVHVFISPVVPVARDGGAEAATVLPPAYTGVLYLHQRHEWPLLMGRVNDDDPKKKREKWLNEMRGWLIVVAVLVASVTYQAGLSPPGGFWQDSIDGHFIGSPVLASIFPTRKVLYTVVFGVAVLSLVYVFYTMQLLSKLWSLKACVLWARGDGAQPVPDHIAVEAGVHRSPDDVGRS